MRERVNVAAVQMDVHWLEPEKNVQKMCELAAQISRQQPVDLVVFPELANSGYVTERSRDFGKRFAEIADTIPGYATDQLGHVAAEENVYIVAGILERHPHISGTVYNSAVLVGPKGDVIGVYHKVHIPGEEKHYFFPGNTCEIFKTDLGNIGIVICYDLRFPELPRMMAIKGAEILVAIYNGPLRSRDIAKRYEIFACARAIENQCYVVALNRTGRNGDLEFDGSSAIADPSGNVLAVAGSGEEILRATFSRDYLLEERAFHTQFRDRRPELYHPLCEPF